MTMIIRKIEERDRKAVFEWLAGLGWNPGIRDAECLMATDPDGMFMAELDGVPVGCATAIAYNEQFGFAGALVVDPKLRGKQQGFMLKIFRHVNAYMGDRLVGTDALPLTQQFFENTGCRPAYRHIRYEGVLAAKTRGSDIVPLSEVPFPDLVAYDAANFPVPRPHFLRVWLEAYGAGGFACLRNDRLAGFGVIRQALRGFRVGPLVADQAGIAESLLRSMQRMAGEKNVALDVPESNVHAITLAQQLGFKQGFDTLRMYKPAVPDIPEMRTFGIASYEFG